MNKADLMVGIITCLIVIITCIYLLYVRYKRFNKMQKYRNHFDNAYLEVWCKKLKTHLEEKCKSKEEIIEELRKIGTINEKHKKLVSKKVLKDIKFLIFLAESDNKYLSKHSNEIINKWAYKNFTNYSMYRFTIVEIQTLVELLTELQKGETK